MNMPQDLDFRIAAMLRNAGLQATIRSIEACAKGGNNRTYRVTTSDGVFAAKQYFWHAGDARARLPTEFAFLSYAHKVAPGLVPKPYAMDEANGIALHEFIEGRPFSANEIGPAEVQQAASFFLALNQSGSTIDAGTLPIASEACFSIEEHIALIDLKLARLNDISPVDLEDQQALAFIKKLTARWQKLLVEVSAATIAASIDTLKPLEVGQRCISPSDFGFHNALRDAKENIRFLDFEYAGWDDPAKMAGDFFSQIAVPVPRELFAPFVQACVAPFARPVELIERAKLLRPIYQIKWCCIALNVFLPVNLARRHFANPGLDEVELKRAQLAKANSIFQSLETSPDGLH